MSLCLDDSDGKIRLMRHLPTYFALVALAPAVLGAQQPADLVLLNGNIYTVDSARPTASAMAVRAGRILFVGSDGEARKLAKGSTKLIDLRGATVVPGFIDAHAHITAPRRRSSESMGAR
jgi:imidazolonepropionase-like amidohydrolase